MKASFISPCGAFGRQQERSILDIWRLCQPAPHAWHDGFPCPSRHAWNRHHL